MKMVNRDKRSQSGTSATVCVPYLGSAIREDCKCHEEVRRRIVIGQEAFSKRGELLRGKIGVKEY